MDIVTLRFLADESCDFVVVRILRAAGYNVLAVSEVTHRSDDSELIAQAAQERRILLTEDKDFGWLVFIGQANPPGVVLIRFPGNARKAQSHAHSLRIASLTLHPSVFAPAPAIQT